jgi:hypothetical protein
MNPGRRDTFHEIRDTGPKTDQLITGGLLPMHHTPRHIVTAQSTYSVGNSEDTVTHRELASTAGKLFSESDLASVSSRECSGIDSPIDPSYWIIILGSDLVERTIKKAVGPGGSYRKRMARLRYGIRKLSPSLKLPYRLIREILGSEPSMVKRAVAISCDSDDLLNALRRYKSSSM